MKNLFLGCLKVVSRDTGRLISKIPYLWERTSSTYYSEKTEVVFATLRKIK